MIDAVFRTLKQRDASALQHLFTSGGEGFEIQPPLHDAIAHGVRARGDLVATDAKGFVEVVADFDSISPSRSGHIAGGAPGYGPILWEGVGMTGGRAVSIHGGGKMVLECWSGRIDRLLLSPLSIQLSGGLAGGTSGSATTL